MLNSPVVSLFYQEVSAFSSFEDWLTALSRKAAGGKTQIKNPSRNAQKVNWHNLVQWEGPKKNPKKQPGTQVGKEHEVKEDWERGSVRALLAKSVSYRGTKLSLKTDM